MKRVKLLGLAVATGVHASVHAQVTIYPPVRVDAGNNGPAAETAIAVSRINPGELIVGAIDWRLWPAKRDQIGFGISLTAGFSFSDGVLTVPNDFLPLLETQRAADPMVAYDPLTGDLFLGGLSQDVTDFDPNGLFIARKPSGATSFNSTQVVGGVPGGVHSSTIKVDKPLMAAGPAFGNPSQTNLYVVYSRTGPVTPPPPAQPYPATHKGYLWRSSSPNLGQSWAPTAPIGVQPFLPPSFDPYNLTLGFFPLVIPAAGGSGNAGRLVVLTAGSAIYSETNGDMWQADGGPLYTALFPGVDQMAADGSNIPGVFLVSTLVSADTDPRNGWIYAVIPARRASGSANVDLYVTRSQDRGKTFPEVFHLTDADLGTAAQADRPDQFMPAIAIDDFGGVNLLWYDTRHGGGLADDHPFALLDAYYARIVNLGGPSQSIEVHRLTAQSFTTWLDDANHPYGPGGVANNPQFVGDYQWIAASGCSVYPCYMSAHTGERHIYVHRINLCPTDTDDSGLIAAADAVLFTQLFPAGDPRADINRDQVVNAADAAEFQARFAAGGP